MSRTEARVKCSIWTDPDFLALSRDAKLAYHLLLEQDDLSLCGVAPLREVRWGHCLGLAPAKVRAVLGELEAAQFVVVDSEEQELWVRTSIRHDHIEGSKLLGGAQRSFGSVRSQKIRSAFCREYPDLAEAWHIPYSETAEYPIPENDVSRGDRRLEIGDRRLEINVTTSRARTVEVGVEIIQPPEVRLFEVYRERHPKAILTADRKRRVATFIKSHGAAACEAAIRGIVYSPFHMGENEQGKVYDDWEVIFKSAKNLETFAAYWEDPSKRPMGRSVAPTKGESKMAKINELAESAYRKMQAERVGGLLN